MASHSAISIPQGEFRCGLCDETFLTGSSTVRVDVANDAVCVPCFRDRLEALFEAAVHKEEAYPVMWGPVKLHITDFIDLVSPALIFEYQKKGDEFTVNFSRRVYCFCNAGDRLFLGEATTKGTLKRCEKCHATSCLTCRQHIRDLELSIHSLGHACKPFIDMTEQKLPEETRGKEWQMCPGQEGRQCGAPIALNGGCNQIDCPLPMCAASFCYLCGEAAQTNEGH